MNAFVFIKRLREEDSPFILPLYLETVSLSPKWLFRSIVEDTYFEWINLWYKKYFGYKDLLWFVKRNRDWNGS